MDSIFRSLPPHRHAWCAYSRHGPIRSFKTKAECAAWIADRNDPEDRTEYHYFARYHVCSAMRL